MKIEDFRRMSLEAYPSLRRKALQEALQEALIMNPLVNSAAGASGGGSSHQKPTAKQIKGQTVSAFYQDPNRDNYQLITAVGDSGTLTDIIDTGIPTNYNIFYNFFAEDGAQFYFGETDTSHLWISLIDGGGNWMLNDITQEQDSQHYWNVFWFENNVISWVYDTNNDESLTYKWYVNGVVNETSFPNLHGPGNAYIYASWFNGYEETLDGSHTMYLPTFGNSIVYLLNANGNVIDISDIVYPGGREPENSYMSIGNNTMALWYYDGVKYDMIRLLSTDGSYIDVDITEYTANNVYRYDTGFGWMFVLVPDDDTLDTTLVIYDETNGVEIVNVGPLNGTSGWDVYAEAGYNAFDYSGSPEGFDNAYMIIWGANNGGSQLTKYESVKIISRFKGHSAVTWQNQLSNVGFFSADKCAKPTFFVNDNESIRLQLLTFSESGFSLDNTESAYEFVTGYFQIISMGKYTFLQWYDEGHAPSQEQAFKINNGADEIASIWTSTNNGWGFNYDTAWITQSDENKTYYFTPAAESWAYKDGLPSIIKMSDNVNNGGADWGYVDNHNFGTTLFNFNDSAYAVLTRDTNENLALYEPNFSTDDIYAVNDHILFKQVENIEGTNKITYYWVDTLGNVTNSVQATNDGNYIDIIASKRCYLVQYVEGENLSQVWSINLDRADVKVITSTDVWAYVNDMRWRDY